MRGRSIAIALACAITAACGGGNGNSVEAFCEKAASAQLTFARLGDTPSDNAQAIALFEDLVKSAPNDIKSDLATVLRFLKGSSSTDSPSDESVTDASANVVQYFRDKCQVDLTAGGASSPASQSSGAPN
ncbi:MAG: hypothetical protein QOD38_2279 [Acidimicrobiaceae bacterium]